MTKYPDFRREYEAAVIVRNYCWMDDCVDIADSHKDGETTSDRKLRIDTRMRQLNGMSLKMAPQPRS